MIEMLVYPAVRALDVTGPFQVFTCANELAETAGAPVPYALRLVAQGGHVVTASAGLSLAAEDLSAIDAPLDTLLVPGGDGVKAAAADPALLDWVCERAAQGRRVASVCTGAFLLAAAGLLAGRRGVTHWAWCDELARQHPAVRVDPEPFYVRDGPVWTSAGVTAGIDLALALVEEDLGHAAALAVAGQSVLFLRRTGGQSQFRTPPELPADAARFAPLHAWISGHLTEDFSLPRLAEQAGMTLRTFRQQYPQATGVTPFRTVERLRMEAARQLLTHSRIPVSRIAKQCGFGSEAAMSNHFLRQLGIMPQEYRDRFGF